MQSGLRDTAEMGYTSLWPQEPMHSPRSEYEKNLNAHMLGFDLYKVEFYL